MELQCPHCNKVIDLVGPKELANEYGLRSNSVQHYRTRGFPEPALKFENRYVYFRQDVDDFANQRAQKKVGRAVEEMARELEHLGGEEREQAIRRLLETFSDGNEEKSPKAPSRKRDTSARSPRKGGRD